MSVNLLVLAHDLYKHCPSMLIPQVLALGRGGLVDAVPVAYGDLEIDEVLHHRFHFAQLGNLLGKCLRLSLFDPTLQLLVDCKSEITGRNSATHWALTLLLPKLTKAYYAEGVLAWERHWLQHRSHADVAISVKLGVFGCFGIVDFRLLLS